MKRKNNYVQKYGGYSRVIISEIFVIVTVALLDKNRVRIDKIVNIGILRSKFQYIFQAVKSDQDYFRIHHGQ